jgi:hypothetical protein
LSIENRIPAARYEVEQLGSGEVRIIAQQEVQRSAGNVVAKELQNPNSFVSKSLTHNVKTSRRRANA